MDPTDVQVMDTLTTGLCCHGPGDVDEGTEQASMLHADHLRLSRVDRGSRGSRGARGPLARRNAGILAVGE